MNVGHPVLGQRICIIGPSSCGKSTMADAIGKKYELTVVHLDKLHHQPWGSFVPRPPEEYLALHDAAIADDRWVMEGNYTKSMPQRFARADSIVHIKMNRFGAVWRFIKRYYLNRTGKQVRIGQPDFVEEKFSWDMIWWILEPKSLSPRRRGKLKEQQALLRQHADKTHVVRSFKEMEKFL